MFFFLERWTGAHATPGKTGVRKTIGRSSGNRQPDGADPDTNGMGVAARLGVSLAAL
jgi:hypothetical protein